MPALAQALSVRVSTCLGAGCPKTARHAVQTAQAMCLALALAVGALIALLRRPWSHVFTNQPAVVEAVAALMPLYALSLPGDASNAILQGMMRGAGAQRLAATTNLLSYWLGGLPLAALLAFHRPPSLGLHGLWWGLVAVNTWQVRLALVLRFCLLVATQRPNSGMLSCAPRLHAHPFRALL